MASISPSFAREALEHLQGGNPQAAVDLCLEGTAKFPWYATGKLMLGRSYEALGKSAEALLAYRDALALLPEETRLLDYLREAETLANTRAQEPPGEMDGIIEQLRQAKRIVPAGDNVEHPAPVTPPAEGTGNQIVTETLAEIYARQGEYREAIDAYRKLLQQRPDQSEKYGKRLEELEVLLREQLPPMV